MSGLEWKVLKANLYLKENAHQNSVCVKSVEDVYLAQHGQRI